MIYVYIPVYSDALVKTATNFLALVAPNQNATTSILFNKSRITKSIERVLGWKRVLSCVNPGDTLYVLAHGNGANTIVIGEKTVSWKDELRAQSRTSDKDKKEEWSESNKNLERSKRFKSYSAPELAWVMSEEGLKKSFVDLRLLSCGAGLSISKQTITGREELVKLLKSNGKNPTKMHLDKSFAEGLLIALQQRGYDKVTVTGYLGDVSVKPGESVTIKLELGVKLNGELNVLEGPLEDCSVKFIKPGVFFSKSYMVTHIQEYFSKRAVPLSLGRKLDAFEDTLNKLEWKLKGKREERESAIKRKVKTTKVDAEIAELEEEIKLVKLQIRLQKRVNEDIVKHDV